jgi:hypothetical protein
MSRTLPRDERGQAGMHDRSFLTDSAQLLRALQQIIVDN